MKYRFALLSTLLVLGSCSAAPADEQVSEEQGLQSKLDASADTLAQDTPAFDPKIAFPHWYAPTEPFQVMDNLYYVGSRGLAVWFLPTPEGHIVIDGGAPETAAQAIAGIRQLGYDPADIAILLNTHAHFDHSGGLAELKALSGAQMIASQGDRSALEGGFYLGSEDETVLNAPPVEVDQTIGDGEIVSLGGTMLTAMMTPGHSRGCTSWTLTLEEDEVAYETLIFCSATVAANRLVAPPQYEGIVDDYSATFARIADWQPDIYLANHPEFFSMEAKRAALEAGDQLAFVDREQFPELAARLEAAFEEALATQSANAKK